MSIPSFLKRASYIMRYDYEAQGGAYKNTNALSCRKRRRRIYVRSKFYQGGFKKMKPLKEVKYALFIIVVN